MGRLVIAHHKSYHPYRRDNIERVRKDEEQAEREAAVKEGRVMLADSEARIDMLRSQAGLDDKKKKGKGKAREDDDMKALEGAQQPSTSQGHINFFEDLEANADTAAARASKSTKQAAEETDKGVPLAPSKKDLKPWYNVSSREMEDEPVDDRARGRRDRDTMRKATHDPLTAITQQLASSNPPRRVPPPPHQSSKSSSNTSDPVSARLSRESAERARAQALIARKKKEREAKSILTPSTVYEPSEYGDMFNRDDVEAAHAKRERERPGTWGRRPDVRERGWGDERPRRRAW